MKTNCKIETQGGPGRGVPEAMRTLGALGGGFDYYDVSHRMLDFGLCVQTLRWFSHMGSEGAPRSIKRMTRLQRGLLNIERFPRETKKHGKSVVVFSFKRLAFVFEYRV